MLYLNTICVVLYALKYTFLVWFSLFYLTSNKIEVRTKVKK